MYRLVKKFSQVDLFRYPWSPLVAKNTPYTGLICSFVKKNDN